MNAIGKNAEMRSILSECRQCGTCCKKYRKITLYQDEVEFIEKMGGYVGIDLTLKELRESTLEDATTKAHKKNKIFMIHPDDKGCVFLQKKNGKFYCKIYHYRPRSCRGFKCNLADTSFSDLFCEDSIFLLGENRFGFSLDTDKK
ncbi:MAG: YkgJ family cysteine cluster protein [Desulfotalea sp.]